MKDLKKGNFFENQEHLANRVQNLDDNGNLTGDVTGNLTGDVTGDLTGDVTTSNIQAKESSSLGIYGYPGDNVTIEGNDSLNINATDGSIRFVTFDRIMIVGSLPASDPNIAGQLWNDSGTLKISAG